MNGSIVLFVVCALVLKSCKGYTPEMVHEFGRLNFTFPSASQREEYFNKQYYKNCMIAGIKLDKAGDVYVSVPRWKEHVPATLARVVEGNGGEYILEPYPSWEMNNLENSDALRSVLGFEVDRLNRMWILDQGKVNGTAAPPGSIKLVIWDIDRNVEVHRYVFSEEEASLDHSFLNDVVVDPDTMDVAYISDSGLPLVSTEQSSIEGAILVYHLADNYARRVLSSHFSTVDDRSLWIVINGEHVLRDGRMRTGADGIALSCDGAVLYFCPLTSHILYAISTSTLRYHPELSAENVVTLGSKHFASDGLACSSKKHLFMTSLEDSGVMSIPEMSDTRPLSSNRKIDCSSFTTVASNSAAMMWPDTIAFSGDGYLYFVSNQLYHFLNGDLSFAKEEVTYRIWRVNVGQKSYVQGCQSDESSTSDRSSTVAILAIALGVAVPLLTSLLIGEMLWRKRNGQTNGLGSELRQPLAPNQM